MTDSVILLTEYHANSIRLRRVLLLRSDIRLTPSDICPLCRRHNIIHAVNITRKISLREIVAASLARKGKHRLA